jgi:hypothetical protein
MVVTAESAESAELVVMGQQVQTTLEELEVQVVREVQQQLVLLHRFK